MPEPTVTPPPRDGRAAVAIGLLALAAIGLTWPFANAPYNDDWSYADTVRQLLDTGHLHYNGWASASLIAQAYWGAAWARAFGFSYAVLRLSTVPLAVSAVSLCYLIARRAGLRSTMAAFAALLLGWSPLFLPVAATFMTDAPGLFFTFASLYALIRAAEAESTGAAIGWLATGVVVGGVGGTGRQIVWVVPLTVGPYAAWVRRREPVLAAAVVIGWVAVLASAAVTVRWFNRQPLTIPEPSPFSDVRLAIHKPVHYVGSVIALALTFVCAVLPAAWPVLRDACRGRRAVVAAAFLAALVAFVGYRHVEAVRSARAHHEVPNKDPGHLWPYAMAPWISNTLDPHGVMGNSEIAGERPIALPAAVRVAIAAAVFVATAALLAAATAWATDNGGAVAAARRAAAYFLRPDPRGVARPALTLFAIVYLLLLLPRSARDMTFDRYVLPLMPCLAVPLLLLAQRRGDLRPPPLAWAALAIYAAYAIATTQEVTALARARAAAGERLLAAGVPRTAIHAGFEFDSVTQLLATGHMNDPRIHPRWAYHRRQGPTPVVLPVYVLEQQPDPETVQTPFGSVAYWSLMPPFRRRVYIDRYPDPWWADPARAATRPAARVWYGLPDAALPDDYDAPDTPTPPGVRDTR